MPQLPHEIKIKAPRGFEMGARRLALLAVQGGLRVMQKTPVS